MFNLRFPYGRCCTSVAPLTPARLIFLDGVTTVLKVGNRICLTSTHFPLAVFTLDGLGKQSNGPLVAQTGPIGLLKKDPPSAAAAAAAAASGRSRVPRAPRARMRAPMRLWRRLRPSSVTGDVTFDVRSRQRVDKGRKGA